MHTGQLAVRESGIVPEHAERFIGVARQNNQFILFRKVEKWATGLIKENFATKNLHVKGKSSDWGPQAGFICCDQNLSKLHGTPKVSEFNGKVKDSLSHGFAKIAPLHVSPARVAELERMEAFTIAERRAGGRLVVQSKGERFHLMTMDWIPQQEQNRLVTKFGRKAGLWVFHEKADSVGNKVQQLVEVLANEKGAPLTADYDLFAICPHLSADGYGGALKGASPGLRFTAAVGAVRAGLGQEFRRKEDKPDKDLGYMTAVQRCTKNLLNDAAHAAGYTGGDVCHHGTEVDNPVTELDFPVTAFVPGSSRGIYGAQNQTELEDMVRDILRAGYMFYANRSWHTTSAVGGVIYPGRPLELSKMTQAWNTSFNVQDAMRVLAQGDVA